MKLAKARDIMSRTYDLPPIHDADGYIVTFEILKDDVLVSDHFPDTV